MTGTESFECNHVGVEPPYRLLAEMASDVAMQINSDSRVVWISPNIHDVLGWSADEIVGTSIFDRMHPDDQTRGRNARDRVMSGDVVRNDLRFLTKDGTYRWVSARLAPIVDEHGTIVGRVAGWHDVSAEYELREQLHEREEQFRILAENASDIVVQVDPSGILTWVSPSVESMLGWTPAELVGRPADSLVDEVGVSNANVALGFAKSDQPMHFEVRLSCKDGTTRWMAVAVRPVFDDRGETIVGRVVGLRDIDAEIAIRAALEVSEREAKEASAAKTVFLSRVSHELRTPLNAVLGFAQLLQLEHLTPAQTESVEKIISGGRHLLDLINEILDISRIESGSISISLEPVPLREIVTASIDMVRGLAENSDVTLEPFEPTTCPEVALADRQRAIQVVLNLLSNALKYNRPGGSVRVRCGSSDGMVLVAVQDDGSGIAPELLDRLFQPFDRLGAERSGVEGTGIGLAVARGLAETMGGRIDVESTVGVGSTFTLVLPSAT